MDGAHDQHPRRRFASVFRPAGQHSRHIATSVMTTRAPSAMSRLAWLAPIPRAPPVTNATLLSTRPLLVKVLIFFCLPMSNVSENATEEDLTSVRPTPLRSLAC